MPLHIYQAIDRDGRMIRGQIEALNPVDLEQRLKRIDLDLVEAAPARQSKLLAYRLKRRELISFCFHLEQLSRAGVALLDCLVDLRDSLAPSPLRQLLADIIENVSAGKTLSQALAMHQGAFDAVFISLIRAGEESGKLPDVLHDLSETLKWQDELSAQARRMLLYPTFLLILITAVIFFLMLYLVPQMTTFISSMGQQLPWHTRLLIATSEIFITYWSFILAVPTILLLLTWFAYQRQPGIAARIDAARLSAPWLGIIHKKIVLSRFARVFAMLYASGIPVLDAIRTSQGIVGNRIIAEALRQVGAMISEGRSISLAFRQVDLFPNFVVRMVHVGESTGSLDTALNSISYFYSRDVRESIARLQTLIEPVMTLVVGVLLGWVMLAVLGPIYDTISQLRL